jgi:transglutaminase-like putative cysteine protease
VLGRVATYYGVQNLRFKADYTTAEADTTLFLILVIVPVTILLTLTVIRNVFVGMSSIVLFLPVSASFAFGLIPSERYLITYVVCILYLTRSAYSSRHTKDRQQKTLLHRISSRAAIWLSLISILIFFIMKLFVTQEEYDNLLQIKEMKAVIQTAMHNFSIEDFSERLSEIQLFTRKVSSTGLNGGELGKTGQVQYLNTKHLMLTAPIRSIEEGIYLKGYVGSVYTGDKWVGHSEETQAEYEKLLKKLPQELFPTVNQMDLFLDHFLVEEDTLAQDEAADSNWYEYSLYSGTMKVEYVGANKKFLYAPYFTDYGALENILYEQDLYASPVVREDNYEFNYYFNLSLLDTPAFYQSLYERLNDYTDYEKQYRDYVHKVYTILPEEGLADIKRDFSPERVITANGTMAEKIEYIRNYLDQNTDYSLTPGKLPEGKDFVEYFLYENRVGYCAHYASAATLMLRAMGIPARYVEGYAVGEEQLYRNVGSQEVARYTDRGTNTNIVTESEVFVMDYNAHAWVEVYFDNCGWIPVEFTPGSAVDYTDKVVADIQDFSNNIEEGNSKKDLEEESAEPTPVIEQPEVDQTLGNDNRIENTAEEPQGNRGISTTDFLFFGILALLLAASWTAYLVFGIRRRNRARHDRNHNKRAIFLFSDIEKMLIFCQSLPKKGALLEESVAYVKEHCSYVDVEELDQLLVTINKARFGRGHISSQELREVIRFHNLLYHKVYQELSPIRRIYLKFIL